MMDQSNAVGAGNIWAVVPVKSFHLAKQRLSPMLSNDERSRLVRTMLVDVLTSLRATPGLAGIAVVTSDPQATKLAALFEARVIPDEAGNGLNAAVQQGLNLLDKAGAGALVVPADVPFATADDYSEILSALNRYHVVLAPASSDGGTNALAMRSANFVKPCFGEDSFARHRTSARANGFQVGIVQSQRLGHDIDNINDIIASRKMNRNSTTSVFLEEIALIRRIGLDALPVAARYI